MPRGGRDASADLRRHRHARAGRWWRRGAGAAPRRSPCRTSRPTSPTATASRYWAASFRPRVMFNCAAFTARRRLREPSATRLRGQRRGGAASSPAAARGSARAWSICRPTTSSRRGREPYARTPRPRRSPSTAPPSSTASTGRSSPTTRWWCARAGSSAPAAPTSSPPCSRLMDAAERRSGGGRPDRRPPTRRSSPGALWELRRCLAASRGIVHYRNREPVSWFDFAARDRPTAVGSPGRGDAGDQRRVSPPRAAPGLLGARRRALREPLRPSRGALEAGPREYLARRADGRHLTEEAMRVLITGITGFAGSHLADYLLAEHPEVEVFGTYRWRSRRENIEHLERQDRAGRGRAARPLVAPRAAREVAPRRDLPPRGPELRAGLVARPGGDAATNVTGQTNLFEAIRSARPRPGGPDRLLERGVRPGASRTRRRSRRPTRCARSRPTRCPRWRRTSGLPVLPELRPEGDPHPRLQPRGAAARRGLRDLELRQADRVDRGRACRSR